MTNNGPGLILVVEKFPGANTLDVTKGLEEAIGLSVSQAAEDIGVSKATISRIENGGRISGEVARKVRVWLDSVAS